MNDPVGQPFAVAIRKARRERGLSQGQLAKLVDVERTTVSSWEMGHREPAPRQMHALKELFGPDFLEDLGAPPVARVDAVSLAFWLGRAQQIEAHLALVLREQQQFVEDLGDAVVVADHSGEIEAQAMLERLRAKAAPAGDATPSAAPTPAAAASRARRR